MGRRRAWSLGQGLEVDSSPSALVSLPLDQWILDLRSYSFAFLPRFYLPSGSDTDRFFPGLETVGELNRAKLAWLHCGPMAGPSSCQAGFNFVRNKIINRFFRVIVICSVFKVNTLTSKCIPILSRNCKIYVLIIGFKFC